MFCFSSPNSIFTAGFFPVGDNAYSFAIWFTEPLHDESHTVVWMANRNNPVNGKNSKLSLLKSGNLVLTDAGQFSVWSSETKSESSLELKLHDNGNLLLIRLDGGREGETLWQSFDSPTDTLLPGQQLKGNSELVSCRSLTNYSSGFYKLFFENNNVLRLLYQGLEIRSVYWPPPWMKIWEDGRSPYNSSSVAVLDSFGHFISSDKLEFNTSDYGSRAPRRLKLDVDGNVRAYSLDKAAMRWDVTWQAMEEPCKIHGICGESSVCTYSHETGRMCTCLPGYKRRNLTDWAYGCAPDFELACNDSDAVSFLHIPQTEFYGFDIGMFRNKTYKECEALCLKNCDCVAFQFKSDDGEPNYSCLPKTFLFNGYHLGFKHSFYLKVPREVHLTFQGNHVRRTNFLGCSNSITNLDRGYRRKGQYGWMRSFAWSTCAIGAFELIFLIIYLYKTRQPAREGYLQVATGFKRYTYSELKKSSGNFREEIGRGGGGVVYKAKLSDGRDAAIKRLKEASQGEAEFLAEVSSIGKIHHMNLIESWGYCAEGKHRLLVYEYLENGSLAANMKNTNLDWEKRLEVAIGTAKGLAYLHEECLEWVLHCDVKPQNILLDAKFQPKVADFGLSKLLNRGGTGSGLNFSTIRGTRGYMAPEWVYNLPITSKVDVYSYGVVVLEMITGRSPTGLSSESERDGFEQRMLVAWAREKMERGDGESSWIENIVDPAMGGKFDAIKMEILLKVALRCVEEDGNARPTMSQVVDLLLHQEMDD